MLIEEKFAEIRKIEHTNEIENARRLRIIASLITTLKNEKGETLNLSILKGGGIYLKGRSINEYIKDKQSV